MLLNFHLSELSINLVNMLAKFKHNKPEKIVEVALINMLEDQLDTAAVKKSIKLSKGKPTKSLEQLREELGLGHSI